MKQKDSFLLDCDAEVNMEYYCKAMGRFPSMLWLRTVCISLNREEKTFLKGNIYENRLVGRFKPWVRMIEI